MDSKSAVDLEVLAVSLSQLFLSTSDMNNTSLEALTDALIGVSEAEASRLARAKSPEEESSTGAVQKV